MESVGAPGRAVTALKRQIGRLPASWQLAARKMYYRYSIPREPEPREFGIIRHLISDGTLIVDGGANIGIYTTWFARHARPGCVVLSIEPIPKTFDILQATVSTLRLSRVRTVQCALSDESRRVTMEVPADSNGSEALALARIRFTDRAKPPLSMHEVEAIPLDTLVAGDGRPVSFIKYDVEMHELEAITGSLAVIRRDHPALFVEIQPDLRHKRSQRDDIIALLRPEGYRAFWYDGRLVRRWRPSDAVLDYFFLTPEHTARLQTAGALEELPS